MKPLQKKYYALISYRHADNKQPGRQWATWLHQAIETYEVPAELVGEPNSRGETIPARIFPIFRDEEELPADADLGNAIVRALDSSQLLLVLCSPNAVASTYVADEIHYFKQQGHSGRIVAAIIDGEPNVAWDEAKQASGLSASDECFPLPLQFEYDDKGQRTAQRAEPIAADFRVNNNGQPEQGWTSPEAFRQYLQQDGSLDSRAIDNKVTAYQQQLHLMLLKVIAGIIGVPLGELTQRDKEYQLELERIKAKKLRRWLSLVAFLAVVSIIAGAIAYMLKLEADASRKTAEEQEQIALSNSRLASDRAAQANAKLATELWNKGDYSSAAELMMAAVNGASDTASQTDYARIAGQMLQHFTPLKQALAELSTAVFTWNGSSYFFVDLKADQIIDRPELVTDGHKDQAIQKSRS